MSRKLPFRLQRPLIEAAIKVRPKKNLKRPLPDAEIPKTQKELKSDSLYPEFLKDRLNPISYPLQDTLP